MGTKEDRAELLVVFTAGTRDNEHKRYSRFCLNTPKYVFSIRVLEHWIKFPREVMDLLRDSKPNWKWPWAAPSS